MIIFLIPVLLILSSCAAPRIKKAYDEGYAKAEMQRNTERDVYEQALEGGMKSLRLSLAQCYDRLDKCQKECER